MVMNPIIQCDSYYHAVFFFSILDLLQFIITEIMIIESIADYDDENDYTPLMIHGHAQTIP